MDVIVTRKPMNAVLRLPVVRFFFLVICEASNVFVDGL